MAHTALVRVTAPAKTPITLEAAKNWLRVDYDDEDILIGDLIDAAIDRLDGPFGLLNRALVNQVWTAQYDGFPSGFLAVPLARCVEIVSVTYTAPDGTPATLDPSDFIVSGLLTDTCRIRPAVGRVWPQTANVPDAVSVTFRSGFGLEPDHVPASIRHALLEMVATAFENREGVAVGERVSMQVLPLTARAAVSDWKVWWTDDGY